MGSGERTGQQIVVSKGHIGAVWNAAFSPDGHRIVTASDDGSAGIWGVSRSEAMAGSPAVVLAAALACCVGWRTDRERTDLLMHDALDDLFAKALKQLGRTADDPEIAEVATLLRAPLHQTRTSAPCSRVRMRTFVPRQPMR